MKKIIVSALLILILLCISACSNTSEKTNSTHKEQTEQKAENISSNEQSDMPTDYLNHLNDGWKIPTHADLLATEWHWEGEVEGRIIEYSLKFDEWTVDVTWNDGIDVTDHEYSGAPYELNLDKKAKLEIDFLEMNGKMYFNLLVSPNGDNLYVLDITNGEEVTYRILNKK